MVCFSVASAGCVARRGCKFTRCPEQGIYANEFKILCKEVERMQFCCDALCNDPGSLRSALGRNLGRHLAAAVNGNVEPGYLLEARGLRRYGSDVLPTAAGLGAPGAAAAGVDGRRPAARLARAARPAPGEPCDAKAPYSTYFSIVAVVYRQIPSGRKIMTIMKPAPLNYHTQVYSNTNNVCV
ncbi:uncharacterized protein LOC128201242 [Galleria mellonella]|uniref:Uncharacterized protein LOC128201242 n=1 Tax=Galleria mellonella TaxID=7137 RepID=A0ABM3MQE8_GALME|nr:uncharacterized protein LOC128201242 [Galleria mellonella]